MEQNVMEISVRTNRCKNIDAKELRRATKFYAEYVLGKRLAKNISIDIVMEKLNLSYGFCYPVEFGRNIRDFDISLNKNLSKVLILKTLAHEIVHVMQFARGKLKFLDFDLGRWGKRVYKTDYHNYHKLPWEVEAHKLEKTLYKEYVAYCKKVSK